MASNGFGGGSKAIGLAFRKILLDNISLPSLSCPATPTTTTTTPIAVSLLLNQKLSSLHSMERQKKTESCDIQFREVKKNG